MKVRNVISVRLAGAAALLWLCGCGGGGGGGSAVAPSAPGSVATAAPTSPPRAPSDVTISGTLKGTGPYILANRRRAAGARRTSTGFTFRSIVVDGTLYTADAAAYQLKNSTALQPPSDGVYTASLNFSNVPAGNNQWAVLKFTGQATDGSTIALGELAGLINVGGSSTNTSSLSASTTLTFQLFATLLGTGVITPYDLDNTTNLSDVLAGQIGNSGLTPNPNTGVFDAGALQSLYTSTAPGFQRSATIATSPSTSGSVVILRDYTNTGELNLEKNLESLLGDLGLPLLDTPNAGSFLLRASGVLGYDLKCGGFAVSNGQLHVAGSAGTPVPALVHSCSVPNPTGSVSVRNLYGGSVMIGATNDPYDPSLSWTLPFTGGWTTVAPRARGASASPITVATASTQADLVVNDAFAAAFPDSAAPYGVYPTFGTGPLSATELSAAKGSRIDPFRYVESGFAGSTETVAIDTFNPWNVSVANLSLCAQPIPLSVGIVLPACFPVNGPQPFFILRPFTDDGTDLAYYNWAVGGAGGTIVPDGSGVGYDVTPAGAGVVALNTTTPTAMFGRSQLEIFNTLPLGTVWTVTVVGNVAHDGHTSSGANTTCSCGGTAAIVEMDDLANLKGIESVILAVDAGNTAFEVGPIFADPSGTSIATAARRLTAIRRHSAAKRR